MPRKNKETEDLLYCSRCFQSALIILNMGEYSLKGNMEFKKGIYVICTKKNGVKYKF